MTAQCCHANDAVLLVLCCAAPCCEHKVSCLEDNVLSPDPHMLKRYLGETVHCCELMSPPGRTTAVAEDVSEHGHSKFGQGRVIN